MKKYTNKIQLELDNYKLSINTKTKEQDSLLSLFNHGDSVLFKWKNNKYWSVLHVSESVYNFLGYDTSDFYTHKIEYKDCVHKKDLEQIQNEIIEASKITTQNYINHKPYRIITKDGDIKWVLDYTLIVRDKNNEILYFIGHINDISKLKKEQNKSNKQAKLIKEINLNLKDKIKEEVEKNKQQQLLMLQQSKLAQMGEMISMIAHQWRQPLNALSIVNQTVSHKYKKGELDDDFIDHFSEKSNAYIQGMSNTINDFKDFFKPEKQKINFCINDVITNTINMLNPTLTQYSICIEFNLNEKISLNGYPNELGQALINILNNAKDALKNNNINKDKKLIIDLILTENIAIIKIIDNAGGIPEDIIPKIFDPYFSTKDDKNGTGIGLYMTKLIIEEHMNGKINVTNSDGGATFEILFKGVI